MKVLCVFSLVLASVAARGSGPYLPSGWKPDGPAFYLPSEVSKPTSPPQKDVIFSESEASGSDFLREYGPPKDQEVSQDISRQGLPDVLNEQLFTDNVVEGNGVQEVSDVVAEITKQELQVNAEVKAAEEALPVTESQAVAVTESITQIEEEGVQVNDETTASVNLIESVGAVDDFGYIVETTVVAVAPTEKITIEVSAQSEEQVLGDTVKEAQELTIKQQESDQLIQLEGSAVSDITQVTNAAEQSIGDVSEQAEYSSLESSGTSVTQLADINFDVVSANEPKAETVVEQEKKIEKVLQNIPELIASLENEVKSQQAETIQEVPAIVQQVFGSLEQAPEGFLEYGPPGFREYGPPKEELRDNTIEEIPETQSVENSEIRRRRFSPKFRSSKSH